MLIYNVTVTIDREIESQWVKWMKETHIPDVMVTGMFLSYRMSHLLSHDHTDSEIYTIQYLTKDILHLQKYLDEFASTLQAEHKKLFEGKYAVFRTVMEVIDQNEK